jgi:hypothetical protein
MFKGGADIQHCMLCGEPATCHFHDSPRCAAHCDTPSLDAPAPQPEPKPYSGTPLPDAVSFLKDNKP